MDQQARERVEEWLTDIDQRLGEGYARVAVVMGALDEDGVAMRRATWLQEKIREARDDYPGFAVQVRSEAEQAVAAFEGPRHPPLTAGAGI